MILEKIFSVVTFFATHKHLYNFLNSNSILGSNNSITEKGFIGNLKYLRTNSDKNEI